MLTLPKLPVKRRIRRMAVLTSGGDAPGMNAAIRAVVRYGISSKIEIFGVTKGYSGLLEGSVVPLNASSVANIIQRGGTILKTDRCAEFHRKSARREAAHLLARNGIEALVVIGGDGSFTGAHLMEKETGFPTVGIPGTIDNDIVGTEDTLGFDTAVNTSIEAIDRIRDTASSHDRIFLVEVMGRNSGFIAIQTGIGGGAETIVVPEAELPLSAVCDSIDRGVRRGKSSSILVVAEGTTPGGQAQWLATQLEKKGYQSKVCILGHTQRGGSPTAHDRLLGSVLGASAVAYLLAGKSNAMVGVVDSKVAFVPFSRIIGKKKPWDDRLVRLAQILAT